MGQETISSVCNPLKIWTYVYQQGINTQFHGYNNKYKIDR